MDDASHPKGLLLILGLGAWALLSAIVASQNYVEYLLAGSPVSFPLQAAWMLAVLSYWVAVTPLVLRLYRRFPFERGRLPVRILVHLGLASAVTLVHAPFVLAVTALLKPLPVPPGLGFWRALGYTVIYSFHTGLLLYGVVVGGAASYQGYQRARQRELHAARLRAELGEARLRVLEAQIRPHFLFNALNTVSMLVRARENDRAVEMIAELGGLLRESLRTAPHHEVPLAEELELARRYLHVERCRFGDGLEVAVEVDPALEEAMVPHLLLQPLVENAVRHGVAHVHGTGRVRIAATRQGEQLVVEIHDNGGDAAPSGSAAGGAGTGSSLVNVRSRLEQLYGPAASLSLSRRSDAGTVARIAIPFHLQRPTAAAAP